MGWWPAVHFSTDEFTDEAKREAHKSPHRQRALDLLSKSCLFAAKKTTQRKQCFKKRDFFGDFLDKHLRMGSFVSGQFATSVTKKDVEGGCKVS